MNVPPSTRTKSEAEAAQPCVSSANSTKTVAAANKVCFSYVLLNFSFGTDSTVKYSVTWDCHSGYTPNPLADFPCCTVYKTMFSQAMLNY